MTTDTHQDQTMPNLDQQIAALRLQQSRVRPWLAFLVGILFIALGAAVFHGMFGILMIVLGVAGLLAGVMAIVKRSSLKHTIAELETQKHQS